VNSASVVGSPRSTHSVTPNSDSAVDIVVILLPLLLS
jgi:hypothetical protein